MPSACACCGNPASGVAPVSSTRVTGKRVIKTKTSSWEFPQCSACRRHDDEWPGISGGVLFWAVVLTCGIYLYFYLQRRGRALGLCSPACARPLQAVQYLGWAGTVHSFDFHSPVFTREFLIANKNKLVDVSAQARGLLEAQVPVAPAAAPAAIPWSAPPASAAPPAAYFATAAPAPSIAPVAAPAPRVAPVTPFAPAAPFAPASHAPAPRLRAGELRFIGPGNQISVAGRSISAPLAYVTSGSEMDCPAAIVMNARVGHGAIAEPLPYWPSYAEATPNQRARYLDWLESGRRDPAVPIGYVFIHFYGLEERALVEQQDHAAIESELARLLTLYGENRSFRGYAQNLLSFLALSRIGKLDEHELLACLGSFAPTSSLALTGVLAWFHLQRRPLPSQCAAIVLRSLEGVKRGVVATRSAKELDELFTIRYREKFGKGLALLASKHEAIPYRPASAAIARSRHDLQLSIPHVLGEPEQFAAVVELWNDCIDDLKKVSSAKRNAEGKKELTWEGWAALPEELRPSYEHPAQDAWEARLATAPRVGSYHAVTAGQLLQLTEVPTGESATAAQLRQACEVAALLGYAVEPDARVEAKKRALTSEVLVWRVDDARPMEEAQWKSAYAMLSLLLAVAAADGEVAASEGAIVAAFIEELFVMDDLMRSRVEALRHLLTRTPAKTTGLTKALQTSRKPDELRKIGRVMVAVAGADGLISEAEHKSLRSLYKGLGLSAKELAAAIVASGARLASDEPVSVQAREQGAPGQPIPAPATASAAPAPALDGKAIAAILAETREVAAMLAEVLDDEDGAEPGASAATSAAASSAAIPVAAAPVATPAGSPEPADLAPSTSSPLGSLDARYQPIVQQLLTRPSWSLTEIKALAASSKLLPGAIIETVNSWSDEQLGDYLIEEADGWRIHADLLERARP